MDDNHDFLPANILGYHLRTKHTPTRYALGPAFLDWSSQPSPYRRFIGARLIELPLLLQAPTPPFPGPAPLPAPLDTRALGLFFELAFGLSAWKSFEGSTWALRNNPSSGNMHPTEAYALCDAIDGALDAAALYHYAPLDHVLEERARYTEKRVLPGGGFLLGLSAIPWREAWKYGERAFRYCQLDAGHAIGAAAQAAAALGWSAHVLTQPSDDEVSALLGLNRNDASHRREEEHPDLLLWISTIRESPPAIDFSALLERGRIFFGAANWLSDDHDGWPLIDHVINLSKKSHTPSRTALPPLPAPTKMEDMQIGDVIRLRRSAQRMDGASIMPREAFRLMLAATLPGAQPLLSALAFPPRLALVLFVHRVEGLPAGLYILPRDMDALARLRGGLSKDFLWSPFDLDGLPLYRLREGSYEREAAKTACLQAIVGKGCFSVAMLADFSRALAEDGAFGYRRLHWEAGVIGQALYLGASAAGFAGTGVGCFFDDEVHELLGLPWNETEFQDLYHFTVGAPIEDGRLLTLPAYPDQRGGSMNVEADAARS